MTVQSCPSGKVIYPSYYWANRFAQRFNQENTLRQYPYYCHECNNYHLTSNGSGGSVSNNGEDVKNILENAFIPKIIGNRGKTFLSCRICGTGRPSSYYNDHLYRCDYCNTVNGPPTDPEDPSYNPCAGIKRDYCCFCQQEQWIGYDNDGDSWCTECNELVKSEFQAYANELHWYL